MTSKRKRPADEELSQARMHLNWWIEDLRRLAALAHDPDLHPEVTGAVVAAKVGMRVALERYACAAVAAAEEGEP